MQDKIIECNNCKQQFVFTVSEQEFYESKKLGQPKYCLICRGMYQEAEKDEFRNSVKQVTSNK